MRFGATLVLLRVAGEEVLDQRRDVVAPRAQRRQLDVDDVQAIEEIGAEAAVAHLGLEVAVGGGDQPDVDRDRSARAERRDLALLDGAQELRLQPERDLGDLVEEQRAARRRRGTRRRDRRRRR